MKKKKSKLMKCDDCGVCCKHNRKYCGSSSCFYFIGFIGAAFYYISAANSFGAGFVGVLKSLVWPAFVVFEIMKSLGM